MSTTEDRIAVFEKQVKTLYALVTVSLLLFVATAGVLVSSLLADSDVIQAKRFEVVNDQGLRVAEIGVDPDGDGALNVFNKDGVLVGGVGVDEDGSGLIVTLDSAGKEPTSITPSP